MRKQIHGYYPLNPIQNQTNWI